MSPGAQIRARRLANGLSQAQLARRSGSTQAAISRLERGEISPTFQTFERLLAVMGDEAEVVVRRSQGDHNRDRVRAQLRRPPAERLAVAISWNRLAGEFAHAGAEAERAARDQA
jgi:transcriptional regulator with XRE-family HTH domain